MQNILILKKVLGSWRYKVKINQITLGSQILGDPKGSVMNRNSWNNMRGGITSLQIYKNTGKAINKLVNWKGMEEHFQFQFWVLSNIIYWS